MKEEQKRKVGILIFLLLLTIIFILFPSKQLTITPEEQEHYAGDILYDTISLSQKIKVPDNYQGLVFYVGTYMKVLEKGKIEVEIIDSNKKTIYKKNVDMKTVVDSAAVYLDATLEKDKIYTIMLSTKDIKKDMPITLYRIDNKNKEYRVQKNNEVQKNSLDIRYYYNTNSYFNLWYILLLSAIIYLYNCVNANNQKEKIENEK